MQAIIKGARRAFKRSALLAAGSRSYQEKHSFYLQAAALGLAGLLWTT
jgi:hypothetical protein